MSTPAIALGNVAQRARGRTASRILPYVLLLYVIAQLGRNNLSTAALQMPHDLGFDDRVIGFGAGIFALGYVILEIPGTLIVERWSARRWFTRISRAACTESDVREQVELLLLNHERAGSFLGKLVNPKFHSPLDLELL